MKLDVAPQALAELAKVGFDAAFGARPLKRAIQQRIENPIAKLILQGRFGRQGRDTGRRRATASSCSSASCTDSAGRARSGCSGRRFAQRCEARSAGQARRSASRTDRPFAGSAAAPASGWRRSCRARRAAPDADASARRAAEVARVERDRRLGRTGLEAEAMAGAGERLPAKRRRPLRGRRRRRVPSAWAMLRPLAASNTQQPSMPLTLRSCPT